MGSSLKRFQYSSGTQNGECGQVNNLAFGQPVSNITWDPSARLGWNAREFNYQWNVTMQHEVRQNLGIMRSEEHTSELQSH